MKYPIALGLLAGMLMLTLPAAPSGALGSVSSRPGNERFVVYYFHGKFRCPTCLKIEQMAAWTVSEAFEEQIGAGLLEWKAVDIDRPENKHFSADFDLSSPTLVVVRYEGGVVRQFLKLEKVWELVGGDERRFQTYVFSEIDRFLSK